MSLEPDIRACSWCGRDLGPDAGFELTDLSTRQRVAFCRLEHVVPWVMRGGVRERGVVVKVDGPPSGAVAAEQTCASCSAALASTAVWLEQRRAGRLVIDGFCDLDHARAWASGGGRWRAR
ncbi:MAG: hypothetical protein WAO61_07685 [Solirubrobacterales bacterium]